MKKERKREEQEGKKTEEGSQIPNNRLKKLSYINKVDSWSATKRNPETTYNTLYKKILE